MNKTAIVTGASGFIGNALIKELVKNGYEVVAVVRPGKGAYFSDFANCNVVEADLFEIGSLEKKLTQGCAEFFFHLAWAGTSGPARTDYSLQLENIRATIEACAVAKRLGCRRFIVSGSIMEKEAYAAISASGNRPGLGYIYGVAKLAAKMMCLPYASSLGIDLLWGAITNAYGVGENSPRMVNTSIKKCISGISPEFSAATQNYDFIYIDDVVRALRLIAEKGKSNTEYLIGSGEAKPLKLFLDEMQREIAPNLPFNFGAIPFTGVNLPLASFSTERLADDTGFTPEVDFATGCRKTMEWLKSLDGGCNGSEF